MWDEHRRLPSPPLLASESTHFFMVTRVLLTGPILVLLRFQHNEVLHGAYDVFVVVSY